jgi:hypothetical protein
MEVETMQFTEWELIKNMRGMAEELMENPQINSHRGVAFRTIVKTFLSVPSSSLKEWK